MAFVRSSKYRHVFGQSVKADQHYTNISISKNSADSSMSAVNTKFLAVCVAGTGGGPFLVLPLSQCGRLKTDQKFVNGHSSDVIDLAWAPFNENLLASCSDDCTVMIWDIPDEGVTDDIQPVRTLAGHEKRVNLISWHPTADSILISAGGEGSLILWNIETEEAVKRINFDSLDFATCVSWNWDGSLLAVASKQKYLRVIDMRNEVVVSEKKDAFAGTKPITCVFLKDNRIFAVGFDKMSHRLYALYDSKSLDKPLTMEEIDQANRPLFLYYDSSSNIVFTAGKGDSNITYYEITNEAPYVFLLSSYKGAKSQRGVAFMPKRGVNVNTCEIARFYRLVEGPRQSNGFCEPVHMIVPRKSEQFQDDIFPDYQSDRPSITTEEWLQGKNCDPIMEKWKPVFDANKNKSCTAGGGHTNVAKKSNKPQRTLSKLQPRQEQTNATNVNQNGNIPADLNIEALLEDVKKLKATVRKQNKRIEKLEKIIGEAAGDDQDEEEE